MATFEYAPHTKVPTGKGLHVKVPKGLQREDELLAFLSASLKFPAYFGGNWDALDECLSDFSWLGETDVTIQHHDIPLKAGSVDQRHYISILSSASAPWPGKIRVVFPPECKVEIEAILQPTSQPKGPGALAE